MTALALARPALPTAPAYLAATAKFNQSCADLQSAAAQTMTHSALENRLERDGRELLRRLLQAHFDERGPGRSAVPVVDAEGQSHPTARLHTRQLESLFGTVEVTRTGYGGAGQSSLHPLDAALALPPERYSHAVRARVAQAAAQRSFDARGDADGTTHRGARAETTGGRIGAAGGAGLRRLLGAGGGRSPRGDACGGRACGVEQ